MCCRLSQAPGVKQEEHMVNAQEAPALCRERLGTEIDGGLLTGWM